MGGHVLRVVQNCVVVMGVVYACQALLFSPVTDVMAKGSAASGYTYVGATLFLSTFQYALSTGITAGTQVRPDHENRPRVRISSISNPNSNPNPNPNPMQALVRKSVLGTLMGMEHSMFAVAGMIGPLLGTYIFQRAGLTGLSVLCATLFLAIYTLSFRGSLAVGVAGGAGKSKDSKKAA